MTIRILEKIYRHPGWCPNRRTTPIGNAIPSQDMNSRLGKSL